MNDNPRRFDHLPSDQITAETYDHRYFSDGAVCEHGHVDKKRTADGRCMGCVDAFGNVQAENSGMPASKAEAVKAQKRHYFANTICANGHLSTRRVSDGRCMMCARNHRKARRSSASSRMVADKDVDSADRLVANGKALKNGWPKIPDFPDMRNSEYMHLKYMVAVYLSAWVEHAPERPKA